LFLSTDIVKSILSGVHKDAFYTEISIASKDTSGTIQINGRRGTFGQDLPPSPPRSRRNSAEHSPPPSPPPQRRGTFGPRRGSFGSATAPPVDTQQPRLSRRLSALNLAQDQGPSTSGSIPTSPPPAPLPWRQPQQRTSADRRFDSGLNTYRSGKGSSSGSVPPDNNSPSPPPPSLPWGQSQQRRSADRRFHGGLNTYRSDKGSSSGSMPPDDNSARSEKDASSSRYRIVRPSSPSRRTDSSSSSHRIDVPPRRPTGANSSLPPPRPPRRPSPVHNEIVEKEEKENQKEEDNGN
jgi:hypothetical protein